MNIKDIEKIYASDLSTPTFIILANYYYNQKFYTHAKKICKIGLDYYPDHLDVQYIYAKINLLQGNSKEAEQRLKRIVKRSICGVKPYILLIKVMESLNRSEKSIKNFVLMSNQHYYFHPIIQKFYKKYVATKTQSEVSISNTLNQKKKNISKIIQTANNFNSKLATKTMYSLYLSQKKYNAAKSILLTMQTLKKDVDFVNKELVNINQIIDKELL